MPRYAQAWVEDQGDEYADPYPAIREVLSDTYADAAPEAIEQLVEAAYPGFSAEDLEDFFGSLRNAGQVVGRVAKQALPGVVQGATAGAALGPWGALAGGIAGGALSAATSGRASRNPRSAAPARRPAAPAVPAQATGAPAATQLLRTLSRPEVSQTLRSLTMGSAGRHNVNVGGRSVPVGAITNLLGQLLERAEVEMHAFSVGETSGTPAYLLDEAGEYLVDPTDPEQRADLILELFAQADALELETERPEVIYVEADDPWDDYDELEDEALSLYEGVDYDALSDDAY